MPYITPTFVSRRTDLNWGIMKFPECVLVKIFRWLSIKELLNCCKVCSKWNRIANDCDLWINVDLQNYKWNLSEVNLLNLIRNRCNRSVKMLNMSDFQITPAICNELERTCPNLKKLILKHVTFVDFKEGIFRFPFNLHHLDLRYSVGDENAFSVIIESISNLNTFGISNSILSHSNQVGLFGKLQGISALEFSYCNSLNDTCLTLISFYCKQLTSLSLTHCNNVIGNDLCLMTENCKLLKAMYFVGTSLTDENLMKCEWNIPLEKFEISWCRNITERGLLAVLPLLQNLVYLRLCSCGFGHAITDNVLKVMSSLQNIEMLDVSYSREISNQRTAELIRHLASLKQIRISNCKRLSAQLLQLAMSDKNVMVFASFSDNNVTTSNGFHVTPCKYNPPNAFNSLAS